MAILIKDFGNNTTCNDIDELKQALINKYTGKSVTIVTTLPSGIKHPHFVDVQLDGSLLGTYCLQPVLLSCFNI